MREADECVDNLLKNSFIHDLTLCKAASSPASCHCLLWLISAFSPLFSFTVKAPISASHYPQHQSQTGDRLMGNPSSCLLERPAQCHHKPHSPSALTSQLIWFGRKQNVLALIQSRLNFEYIHMHVCAYFVRSVDPSVSSPSYQSAQITCNLLVWEG